MISHSRKYRFKSNFMNTYTCTETKKFSNTSHIRTFITNICVEYNTNLSDLSVFIRSGFHTIFALYGKETFSISVQSHLQVHRWCIVHKQPRIRKLSGPDVSCWTWDQGHHREHHFCFLPRFTSVDWEGWSTSHFHLRQARWFQFPHHKLSVPE